MGRRKAQWELTRQAIKVPKKLLTKTSNMRLGSHVPGGSIKMRSTYFVREEAMAVKEHWKQGGAPLLPRQSCWKLEGKEEEQQG